MEAEWRERKLSPLLLLAAMGLLCDLLLFFNYRTAVNWRYFLTGLPAIAPLSANFSDPNFDAPHRQRPHRLCTCVTAVRGTRGDLRLIEPATGQQFSERRAMSKEYRHQLANVPRDAVMISGSQTIAVTYWKAIGAGDWKTIGTGGGWPGDNLVPLIESYLAESRRVFLDTDPAGGCRVVGNVMKFRRSLIFRSVLVFARSRIRFTKLDRAVNLALVILPGLENCCRQADRKT